MRSDFSDEDEDYVGEEGEGEEEEEEEGVEGAWRKGGTRKGGKEGENNEVDIRSGYLWKKGERRPKVSLFRLSIVLLLI